MNFVKIAIFISCLLSVENALCYTYEDIHAFRKLLEDRNFTKLSSILERKLKGYEAGEVHEYEIDAIIRSFDVKSEKFEEVLNEFVEKDPSGYVGHLLRGGYYGNMAWVKRGGAWASETADSQFNSLYFYKNKAISDLDVVLLKRPKQIIAYAEKIDAYMALGKRNEIERTFREAMKVNPHSFRLYWNYSSTYLPWWGGSLEEVESAISDSIEYSKTYKNLSPLQGRVSSINGYRAQKEKKYAEALSFYNQAILAGDYYAYYHGKAKALWYLLKHGEAFDAIQKALELRPHDFESNQICGKLGFFLKKYDEAEKCWLAVIDMDPFNREAYENMSRIEEVAGDKEKSKDYLEKSFELYMQENNIKGKIIEFHKG